MKMPKFTFCGKREDNKLIFLFLNFDMYSLLEFNSRKRLLTFDDLKQDRIKFGAAPIHSLSDVFVSVAVAAVVVD